MKSLFVKIINRIREDKFFANSFVFFTGSLLVSFGNYLFHFLMARMLSLREYGELQSLLAIFVIFAVPLTAVSTLLTKYVTYFKARKQLNKVYNLFSIFTKKILLASLIFFVIFSIFNAHIANFLKLTSILSVVILGVSLSMSFLQSINEGTIKGFQKFKELSIVSAVSVFFKILLAVFLVRLGFGINGVMGSIALSALIGYFISFFPLTFLFDGIWLSFRQKASPFGAIIQTSDLAGPTNIIGDSFGAKGEEIETKLIGRYFFLILFSFLFTTLLCNIDIVLVKHFFPSDIAGQYSVLSILGRIIFFVSGPIVAVMFPMASTAHSNQRDPAEIFKKTVFLVGLIGFGILLFYFSFPDFILNTLFGSRFLSVSKFVGWFGISMFLYTFVNLFLQYFLSIHRTKCIYLLGAGVLFQVVLISIWHNNLWQIIWIMNIVMFLILLSLLVYYFRTKKDYAINLRSI